MDVDRTCRSIRTRGERELKSERMKMREAACCTTAANGAFSRNMEPRSSPVWETSCRPMDRCVERMSTTTLHPWNIAD
jgi:hypothetical protein